MSSKTGEVDKAGKRMLLMQVATVIVMLEYPDILKSFIAKLLKISKK